MSATEKYDVKRELKALYAPTERDFTRVLVPPLQYLAVDGRGDPNSAPAYAEALEALYGVAYTLKFACKKTLGRDFVVAPLEGLWRSADPTAFVRHDKAAWEWTMLINLPDWVTREMVEAARDALRQKKELPAADRLRLHRLDEGDCVQILHIGPYDEEATTLARLHDEYLPAHGLTFNGDHHEIYLSDPRRAEPAKLKTVLRQPVRPSATT